VTIEQEEARRTAMQTRYATCPSCGHQGRFRCNGKQHWPREVAAKHGLPPVITLWTCPHCLSTVSEVALLPAGRPVEA
jgi:transcription elongation factor Elf1